MKWNWQHKNWTEFSYNKDALERLEQTFVLQAGLLAGAYKHINEEDKKILTVDLMSEEALKTSEIENEYLNRESLRSSLRRQFGLVAEKQKTTPAEQGIAEMMFDLHKNFSSPLSDQTLFNWHKQISNGRRDLSDIGRYRTNTDDDPMQIVSGPDYKRKIHFEAPPSKMVPSEIKNFIKWFNDTAPDGKQPLPALTRAGIAHIHFESIHPFEDGNGRIGRALSEMALSQASRRPALTALSHIIHKNKNAYYERLELNSQGRDISDWLAYFGELMLEAQACTIKMVDFLIEKTKLYDKVRDQLNPRQEKILACMFQEGIEGFKGGLSADNYIKITGTSRSTATRDLQELVEKGALTRSGELKSTRYRLNIEANS